MYINLNNDKFITGNEQVYNPVINLQNVYLIKKNKIVVSRASIPLELPA